MARAARQADHSWTPEWIATAKLSAEDQDLERRIENARLRVMLAQTKTYRRFALNQLTLLEGRRSPAALEWVKLKKRFG